MPLVPAQCWLRTFKITAGTHSATCFVISRHGRQWMITAKHFIDRALPGGGAMTLHRHQGDVNEQVQPVPVPLTHPGADIAVFSLGDTKLVDESMTLIASADGLVLSQQAFFLGYPLPDRVPIAGSIPFVKHGIVSQRAMINGVHVWWVDGIMRHPGSYAHLVLCDRCAVRPGDERSTQPRPRQAGSAVEAVHEPALFVLAGPALW
jgi:hypothetical protein